MNKVNKKIVYVDMDDTIADYRKSMLENPYKLEYPQSVVGFYLGLEPIPMAIESVKYIDSLPGYDIWFLTAPSVINAHSYTEKRLWIEKYFGHDKCHQLILSPHKGLLLGHYLIDDITFGKGQESFTGKLIHYGSEDFSNWADIIKYFENSGD